MHAFLRLAAVGLATSLSVPVLGHAQQVTGAGSSFAAPIYTAWGQAAKAATGIELNYQSIGSGAGLNQVTNRTVDFGASDKPVEQAKLDSAHLLQFPTVMGAVVVIVNVPGTKPGSVRLDGATLADIYLGHVTKWNDQRIAELNPGTKLPAIPIAPVYRADASGTTFVFTSYLSAVAADWKASVGAATSIKWPAGNGANNSNGVSALVRQVRGGIGYVEYSYAAQNHIATAQLRAHDGAFLQPVMDNFAAAAAAADWSHAQNFAVSLLDLPGPKSWPIVTPTFVLVPTDAKDPTKTGAVLKLFDWSFANGASEAAKLDFIPLPAAVEAQVRTSWSALKGTDGQPVFKQ